MGAEGEGVDGGVGGEAHLAAHVARHRLLVRRDRQPRLGQQHHVGDVLSPATFQNGYSAHVTSTKGARKCKLQWRLLIQNWVRKFADIIC